MSSDSSQSSRRRNEYLQEHWQDLTLPIEEAMLSSEPSLQYQEQQQEKHKKKQPSSHRQLQRFEAELNRQELNVETMPRMIPIYSHPSGHDIDEREEEEEELTAVVLDVNMQDFVELYDEYNTLQYYDNMSIDLPWNTNLDTTGDEGTQQSLVDPILPEKMTPLSWTHVTNDKASLIKDMLVEIEKVPNYLAQKDKSFQQIIHQARSSITTTVEAAATATTTNHMEELRKIAILVNRIMMLQTYHLLWTAYLRSGLGQLIIPLKELSFYSTTIPIWPKEVKTLLPLADDKTNKDEIYLNFVNTHLYELDHHLKQYQTELNRRTNHFNGYTLTIQKLIETYIEQNLQSFRMKIEHQIELIHYDYHIRALKLEYLRHHPNEYQEQLMKKICQSKYEQETTEQEYNLLKEQINYYNLPSQSFECSPIAQSTLIDSIENPDIRQQLLKQYRQTAEQSRTNLFYINMKSAENQREEYKKKYEDNVKKMRDDERSLDNKTKIPRIMIQLIDQRCQKISERIKCIYKFKTQSA